MTGVLISCISNARPGKPLRMLVWPVASHTRTRAAFNDMAHAYAEGQGVEEDAKRAGELDLESFNRTLLCCPAPVARHVMAERDKLAASGMPAADTDRAIHALLAWAVELGDAASRAYLEELYAAGTFTRPPGPPRDPTAPLLPPTADPPWTRGKGDG